MKKYIWLPVTGAVLMAALFLGYTAAPSYADERFNPVRDALTKEECSACHMAFQPQMLPRKSWEKMMDTLSNHFGEDASLSQADAEHIRNYLVSNAADSKWRGGPFLRGLSKDAAPLRITETPHWIREHEGEVHSSAWKDPKIKSKANCIACHKDAERGYYDDD